jgi:glycosyltransferase involved in cell wall biosynthesis
VDTFNHERFVERALSSVFDQDFPASEFEVIVVDDGSTDKTPDILRKFANKVRLVRKENAGQASAFNVAIPLARGEIVAFLDGDDWWAKDKLTKVVDAFKADPLVGVVGHGFYEFEEKSQQCKTVVPDFDGYVTLRDESEGSTFFNKMCFFGTSRVAFRKHVLDSVGPLPEGLVVEADEYISTVAIARSSAAVLQDPLTFYRLHPGNLYYFREANEAKLRRKMAVLVQLSKALRDELYPKILDHATVGALVRPIDLEAKKLSLQLDGGWPWETFRVERIAKKLAYSQVSWRYRIFCAFSLALTMVLPPKAYYRVQGSYSRLNLKRLRKFTGEPVSSAKIRYYQIDRRGQS